MAKFLLLQSGDGKNLTEFSEKMTLRNLDIAQTVVMEMRSMVETYHLQPSPSPALPKAHAQRKNRSVNDRASAGTQERQTVRSPLRGCQVRTRAQRDKHRWIRSRSSLGRAATFAPLCLLVLLHRLTKVSAHRCLNMSEVHTSASSSPGAASSRWRRFRQAVRTHPTPWG